MACGCAMLHAEIFFNEPFAYQPGSNLAGQNGGSGFSDSWTGGNSTIVTGLGGSAGAVQIGSTSSQRSFSTPLSSSGRNMYLSYLMNASNFSGGNWTGITLNNSGPFFGIPWNAQKFGFDAKNSTPVQSINFTPLVDTTYLIVFGILSTGGGTVDLKMWATTNLAVDPASLIASAANAQLLNSLNNFTSTVISVDGNYSGALKVSGIAAASTANEAIAASLQSVPEPSTYALFGLGALVYLFAARRRA